MKKTLRIGNYELIFDSRLLIPAGVKPEPREDKYPYPVSSLHEKVERANTLREHGVPFNYHAPDFVEQTEEAKKIEADAAEDLRRYRNLQENLRINGRRFRGKSVFYRVPSYPGLKSWVFRNTSREYSFSIDLREKRKTHFNGMGNMGSADRAKAVAQWMQGSRGPGPTL